MLEPPDFPNQQTLSAQQISKRMTMFKRKCTVQPTVVKPLSGHSPACFRKQKKPRLSRGKFLQKTDRKWVICRCFDETSKEFAAAQAQSVVFFCANKKDKVAAWIRRRSSTIPVRKNRPAG
ncbi:hypothetical protein HUJ05_005337 [Dendroctonus ponderosae]|nr:hypothetical protein HUJ05_005337 [Dendroctonus ponderosae]